MNRLLTSLTQSLSTLADLETLSSTAYVQKAGRRLILLSIFMATTLFVLNSVPPTGNIANAQPAQLPIEQAEESQILIGWFSILWHDDYQDGATLPTAEVSYLLDLEQVDGVLQTGSVQLVLDESVTLPDGPPENLNRQRVRVVATAQGSEDANATMSYLTSSLEAEPLEGDVGGVSAITIRQNVFGAQPWIIIRCRFPDLPIPNEANVDGTPNPGSIGYYEALLNNDLGLNAYFEATSYGLINLGNSQVAAPWFDLPEPRANYNIPESSAQFDAARAGGDCINAADAQINFAPFVAIGLVFNDEDECCRGGFRFLSLDGEDRIWGITYMNASADHLVWAHEIGHALGLGHTSGNGREYNDPWSIMGASACFGAQNDVVGCVGQHPVAEQKAAPLGWIPIEQIITVESGRSQSVSLERLAEPTSSDPLLVRIPIQGSDSQYYTVEARRRIGFDANLQGDGVIVHLVDVEKGSNFQVDLIGQPASDNYYFPNGDDPTIWGTSRPFIDSANNITVRVLSETASGYVVNVENGALPIESVAIGGPDVSLSNAVTLIADVSPITASLPITYVWQATDLAPIQQMGGITNTVDLTWIEPGAKQITVTASNGTSQAVTSKQLTIQGSDLALSGKSTEQTVAVGEVVTITLDALNEGPDTAEDGLLSINLPGAEPLRYVDESQPDFERGTLAALRYAADLVGLTLTPTGRANGSGTFESGVIDGGTARSWSTLGWQTSSPLALPLPDNGATETKFSSGNANMAGNVLLLHFEEAEADGGYQNSAGAGFAPATCAAPTCPADTVDGRYGAALSFDGSQFIQLPSNSRLNFDADGFSQELWFYPTTDDPSPQGLVGTGESSLQYPSLYYEEGGIRFRFGYLGGSVWVQSASSVNVDSWNHVVVTYDGDILALYINGAELYNDDAWSGRIPRAAQSNITIGRVNDEFFRGRIDEVAFYRRALSADEVTDRYQRGATSLGFQFRSCATDSCSDAVFVGPDGTADSTYKPADSLDNLTSDSEQPFFFLPVQDEAQFAQYRVLFATEDSALSPVLTSVSLSPTYGVSQNGRCRGTEVVRCVLEPIRANEQAAVAVAYTVQSGGAFESIATISAATYDPNMANNRFTTNLSIADPTGTSSANIYLPAVPLPTPR